MSRKKKNILNNFFNIDENEELNLNEEQLFDEELSNVLELEKEVKPKEEEPEVKPKEEEPEVKPKEEEVNHPPMVNEKVDKPKAEKKLTDRMKRRLGIN
ncbi:MAG: hypothetical protein ACOC22_02095 [bacterium]